MADMSMDEALAHVLIAEAMTWGADVRATVRFYDDTDGLRVRVAVRTDPKRSDDFTVALVPLADSRVESLAVSLLAARRVIEPDLRRGSLHVVK